MKILKIDHIGIAVNSINTAVSFWKIAFPHPKAANGVLVELCGRTQSDRSTA